MTALRTLLAVSLFVLALPAFSDEARAHKPLGMAGDGPWLAGPLPELPDDLDCRPLAASLAKAGTGSGTRAAKLFEREGTDCAEAGRLSVAIAHFSEAIRRSAWRAGTYVQRGRLHARLGEHELAVLDYDEAIRLSPERPRYHYLRAVSLTATGRAEAAASDLERVLKLDDSEVVSRLQRRLAKEGYDTLVDGLYDEETRRALVACLSRNCMQM